MYLWSLGVSFVFGEFKRANPNPPENALKFRMSKQENDIFCGIFNHGQVLLNKFRSTLYTIYIEGILSIKERKEGSIV